MESFVEYERFSTFLDADPLKIEGDNEKVPYGGSLSLMCMGDSRPEAKRTFWKKDGKDVSQTGWFVSFLFFSEIYPK